MRKEIYARHGLFTTEFIIEGTQAHRKCLIGRQRMTEVDVEGVPSHTPELEIDGVGIRRVAQLEILHRGFCHSFVEVQNVRADFVVPLGGFVLVAVDQLRGVIVLERDEAIGLWSQRPANQALAVRLDLRHDYIHFPWAFRVAPFRRRVLYSHELLPHQLNRLGLRHFPVHLGGVQALPIRNPFDAQEVGPQLSKKRISVFDFLGRILRHHDRIIRRLVFDLLLRCHEENTIVAFHHVLRVQPVADATAIPHDATLNHACMFGRRVVEESLHLGRGDSSDVKRGFTIQFRWAELGTDSAFREVLRTRRAASRFFLLALGCHFVR
mmetsp:Transcript_31529/g.86846  ORF Transcript_31529/g.86846 Transcript_31529/m.86846 type:complete len:324 (-) Transcript_31529:524-1495(-)